MGHLGQGISKVVSEKVLVALGLVFFGIVGSDGSNESDESDRSMGLMGLMSLMGHMGQGRVVEKDAKEVVGRDRAARLRRGEVLLTMTTVAPTCEGCPNHL
jgi:hypothetical protein